MDRHEGGRGPRADVECIGQVLDGLRFPAARWQVMAQADHYGADVVTRAQLSTLPVRSYPDLAGVLAALGLFVTNRPRRVTGPPPAVGRRLR